jgi:indole-3-glycerol phosphate synthase
MGATYLDSIIAWHRDRAARDDRDWTLRAESVAYTGPGFSSSLRAASHVAVIAEVKRRSPSRGWIDEGLDAAGAASDYASGGATAVSVLTDAEFFAGRASDVAQVRAAVALPVLRKDFTVSENDVLDAAEMGAGAVLLIVAALSDDELGRLLGVAGAAGLDALVEVHDAGEARRALDAGAELVGVNQRDLRTFEVDRERAVTVASGLPGAVVSVAESGICSREDVARVAAGGLDAVLVGEALVLAADRTAMTRSLSDVDKCTRA